MSLNFTSIQDGFMTNQHKPVFLQACIYCTRPQSEQLSPDGSFRRCLYVGCRKEFRAEIVPPPLSVPFLEPRQRHPNEYHMFNQEHLKKQPHPGSNEYIPFTLQQTQTTIFSHPQYDAQIRKS